MQRKLGLSDITEAGNGVVGLSDVIHRVMLSQAWAKVLMPPERPARRGRGGAHVSLELPRLCRLWKWASLRIRLIWW